jgi:hypothetical protein
LRKLFLILSASLPSAAFAAANTNVMMSPYQYNMMEPYLNKTMREKLKPKDSEYTVSSNQALARTMANSARTPLSNYSRPDAGTTKARRVVARGAVSANARQQPAANAARAAAATPGRRVVARGRTASAGRSAGLVSAATSSYAQAAQTTGDITMAQCLANYSECMDNYCHRPDTEYDRCYCSSKLQQIDAEYKPALDELTKKIAILQNGGEIEDGMTQEEINEYWNEIFGATGGNSMADLDNSLNIDWAGTESSVRGQNAFVAGDEYCKQHLTGCFYMAENMKSMYRTTIGQDCKKYENNLKKLKYAAEQAVNGMQ